MNKMKKLGITLLAVAMCVLLSVTVLAITYISVDITAIADKNEFCVTGIEQFATVTIKADRQIEIFSLDATVIFPEGWTLVSIVNDEIGLSPDDLNTDGKIMWFTSTNNANTTNLLEITVKIPADVTSGEYEVGIKDLELTKYMNNKYDNYYAESLTVTSTITVKEHDYVTTYDFAADGKSCTAKRVCKNDAAHVETANATITSEVTKDPTCTEKGETTYTATFDKAWAATQTKTVEDVAPINHAWGDATYDFAADGKSCTAKRVCANDVSHVETATATITSIVTTPATCEGMGKTTYTATFDKTWAAIQTKTVEDVAPINHAWGDATYDFAADGKSCTAKRVCANDASHVETATATITSQVTTPATCEGMGKTTYTATFDKAWAATQTKTVEDVVPINHAWGDATYDFAADGKSCTAERVCKNDASHVETATATITSIVTTPATCEGMGKTTYTATFDKAWAAIQTKTVEDVESIGHDWGEASYKDNGDGTHTATYTCVNDANHTKSDDPTEHVYADGECICGAKEQIDDVYVVFIGDPLENSYLVEGNIVTVTYDLPCKLGYWSESDGKYIALTANKVSENTYSFIVPEEINEVLLVVKGDVNGNGGVNNTDKVRLNAYLLEKTNLTAEAKFAADVVGIGTLNNTDKVRLNAYLLEKAKITW